MKNKNTNEIATNNTLSDSALHYDQFFGPSYFEPYAAEVAKRIDPIKISVALEIAAGTGRLTRHIRECIPTSATLIASDISEEMLAVAKQKLSQLAIDWQIIDAQELPYADNSIDLVVCCFGYMFVAEKPKAFAEARRVLKEGGCLLFTTWDTLESNAASWTYRAVAEEYLGKPFPASSDLATSMSDERIITSLLQDAGFVKNKIEKTALQFLCPSAKEAASGFVEGDSNFDRIRKQNPELIEEIKSKLENEFTDKFGTGPMRAPMSAFISQAWK